MSGALPARKSDPLIESARVFFRRLTAGVAVVIWRGPDGPIGLTASTVTSVSLQPPLLLLCIAGTSRKLAALIAAGEFVVHLLRSDQTLASETFAGVMATATWNQLELRQVGAVQVLPDCLAWASCSLEKTVTAGDHVIVLGRIGCCESLGGTPLLWHDSRYHHLDS